jgi:hypothetical protein
LNARTEIGGIHWLQRDLNANAAKILLHNLGHRHGWRIRTVHLERHKRGRFPIRRRKELSCVCEVVRSALVKTGVIRQGLAGPTR